MVDVNLNEMRDNAANHLNTSCYCTTLNRTQLQLALQADALNQDVLNSHPQLFSNTSVFISPSQAEQMRRIIRAVTRVVKLPGYLQKVLGNITNSSENNIGAEGVFMGYDFHMSEQGPKIIEINSVFLKSRRITGTINKNITKYPLEIKFVNLKKVKKVIKEVVQVKNIEKYSSKKFLSSEKLSSFTYV